jgi:hypothetical protein
MRGGHRAPRLPVWEEANDRGYIERHRSSDTGQSDSVSEAGTVHLRMHRASDRGTIPTGRSEATLT